MENEIMLKLEHIVKIFPGVRAVDDVSFDVKKGEIHALLGHNGAGKSTLVKIISGAYKKDSGKIILDSEEINLSSPEDGLKKGIGMVYQELDLIPHLDGSENIFLGQDIFKNKCGFIDANKRYHEAVKIVETFGVNIDLTVPVKTLSVSKQQLITIAKAISRKAKVIIFDEPTAALNNSEAERLFSIMKRLTEQGVSLIWITHRLDEVFQMADRVTLMRDGKWLSTNNIADMKMTQIVSALTGIDAEEQSKVTNVSQRKENVLLSCKNLCAGKTFQNISFDMYEGEVLGITGLIGCGATEIAKSLFAVHDINSGTILINGKEIKNFTPEIAVKKGIAYVSEDRSREGLNLIGSVRKNISLTILKELSKFGFLNFSKEAELTDSMVNKLDIRIANHMQLAGTLSGGNQQKVILAKWLLKKPQIFVMCEPTRGIDIGAKREIHKIIRNLAASGLSILVVSSEVEEIIDTCDRVLILYDGKIKSELLSKDCEKQKMLNTMYGID